MSNLADRQGIAGVPSPSGSSSNSGANSTINKNMKAKDFMPMIKTFIERQGGRAVTKMLVDHFGPYCHGKKQNEEFQHALTTVAEITQTGTYGRAVWTLKKGRAR
jgi:DNA excision repair protein ERCC-6